MRIPRFQLPQPVDVKSDVWIGRAWQAVFDALNHLDNCQDDTRSRVNEVDANLKAWMLSSNESDEGLDQRLADHIRAHEKIDEIKDAKKSVWIFQYKTLRDIGSMVLTGGFFSAIAVILHALGVI